MASESRIFAGQVELPKELRLALAKLMLDKRSGNVTVNIKQGKILGFRIEEIFSI